MTPIRNVSDRERKMQAEIDELRAELAKLKAQEPAYLNAGYSKGTLNGLYEAWGLLPACSLLGVIGGAIQDIQAQGHTREQPAPDRREGLTAHHVYCRVIGEDV